ncbi:MAG: Trypsin-like peptidase domain [Blastocatellia bacterium]
MDSRIASAELLERVEALLLPSVVLVLLNGRAFQTGFYISGDGLVCTCHHGAGDGLPGGVISVRSNAGTFPAKVVRHIENDDLLLLAIEQVDGSPVQTRPVPIYLGEIPEGSYRHAAVSLGYSGLEIFGVPEKPKMYVGEIAGKYRFKHLERFEIFRISQDRGNSGAPVMDLHRLRVMGYVQVSHKETGKLLGGALTFKALLQARPDLLSEWQRACRDFDLDLARHYRERPFPLDLDHLPGTLLEELTTSHVNQVVIGHRDKELFTRQRYVRRAIEDNLRAFLHTSPAKFLMLGGTAGAGKTSLLLQLARQLQSEGFLPFLIKCDGRRLNELLPKTFEALLPAERFTPTRFGQLFNRCRERRWALIFDGLNECSQFSLDEFGELLDALWALDSAQGPGTVKAIFSIRTEFLREYLPTFYFGLTARHEALDAAFAALFQPDDEGRPYIDIGQINTRRFAQEPLELKLMYEHYRETGLRPLTSFEQLSDDLIKIIDRPFILELVMRHYQGQEIPSRVLRADLLRRIVRRILERAGIKSNSEIEQMELYLRSLAQLILRSGERRCPVAELQQRPWHQDRRLNKLLKGTPLLEKWGQKTKIGDQRLIGFGGDWMFEYFLAQYLWEDWWSQCGSKPDGERLAELHRLLQADNDAIVLQHLIVALVFFADRAASEDTQRFAFLVDAINDAERPSFAKGLMHELLDFFRFGYGFGQLPAGSSGGYASLAGLLSRYADHFGRAGGAGLLDYVEYLESIGESNDALWLLDLPVCRDVAIRHTGLQARHHLAVALNELFKHHIDVALAQASQADLDSLTADLRAKHCFVVGRAYQYKSDYARAAAAFELGLQGTSPYSYRCAHQLAFIKVIAQSDFAGAAAQLEKVLANQSFDVLQEDRLESRLLRAICLFRLGQYAEAEQYLRAIIAQRAGQRHRHKLGTALRALADVHLRRFERDPALEVIDQAIESLDRVGYRLSLASAWDTKANIVGLLDGDLETARDYNRRALQIAQQKQHKPSQRWFLQTSAMLFALADDLPAARIALRQAGASNQYEKLRKRFISLLARHCAGEQGGSSMKRTINQLQIEFRDLQLAWYPQVLSLILKAASDTSLANGPSADWQADGINPHGLTSSYLYARIVGAR